MAGRISIVDLIDDDQLLGQHYRLPDWAAARAILKAVHGERLYGAERTKFRELCGDREPPTRPVKEVVGVCGRRWGKDRTAVVDVIHTAAFVDHSQYLAPGARGTVLVCAVSKDQADQTLDYIKGFFEDVPLLKSLMAKPPTNAGIELTNRCDIVVVSNNFRDAARGRSIPLAIINEAGYLPSTGSAAPDTELFRSLRPAMLTIPSSRIWIISSPYRKSGLLYDRFTKFYGKSDPHALAFRGASRTGHPGLDQAEIDRALADDPEGAPAEYLAQWRDGVSSFIGRELIESLVDRDVVVRAPLGVAA
jgi:hypothetical protein